MPSIRGVCHVTVWVNSATASSSRTPTRSLNFTRLGLVGPWAGVGFGVGWGVRDGLWLTGVVAAVALAADGVAATLGASVRGACGGDDKVTPAPHAARTAPRIAARTARLPTVPQVSPVATLCRVAVPRWTPTLRTDVQRDHDVSGAQVGAARSITAPDPQVVE